MDLRPERLSLPGCPLCGGTDTRIFFRQASPPKRFFLACPDCGLVFVPHGSHVSFEEEKRRYDLHQNNPGDPGYAGYREYVKRLAGPVLERVRPGSYGLDFGSGPGSSDGGRPSALAVIFKEAGHRMEVFDPIYAPDERVLEAGRYDFVTASEVVEHLREPKGTLERIWALVRPGGWLGIMTQMPPEAGEEAFCRWTYKNDPTHVIFYSPRTFEWLARRWAAKAPVFPARHVILIGKGL